MNFIRKVLLHEYGVRVKTIRIHGNIFTHYGDTWYLPYYIAGCSAGCAVDLFKECKVYGSLEAILEDAKKGMFK